MLCLSSQTVVDDDINLLHYKIKSQYLFEQLWGSTSLHSWTTFVSLYVADFHKNVLNSLIHHYADDTQIYYSFTNHNVDEANTAIKEDLRSVLETIEVHNLCLHPT